MSLLLVGAAGFVAGGAIVALVFYVFAQRRTKAVVEPAPAEPAPAEPEVGEPWDFAAPPPAVPLEPSTVKFRVILYTSSGARARQLFERLEPSHEVQHAETVELRHFSDVRGRKP